MRLFVMSLFLLHVVSFSEGVIEEKPRALEFYIGSAIGYSSLFNLALGVYCFDKYQIRANVGLFSSPKSSQTNLFFLTYKPKHIEFGIGILQNQALEKNILNPGVYTSLNVFDFLGFKFGVDGFCGVPVSSLKLGNIISINLKSMISRW
jgi:hypothetical protein